MSWQAQTAVTLYSNQTNIKRLRLLLFLANGADAAGLIDPAPNQETLAEFLDCTARTVRTCLAQIEADGELKQTRVGSGPGNASAYQITLPMPENGRSDPENNTGKAENEGVKVEENPGNISTIEALKAEIKAEILELKVEISELKVEIFRLKGGKVEGERWKGHSTKNADDPSLIQYDPITIQEEEGESPQPPVVDYQLADMVNALVDATGMSGHKFWATLSAEARDFLDGGYTPAEILEFYTPSLSPSGWNWFCHDWRGRKGDRPKLADIWQTISGARQGVPIVPQQANGRASPAPAAELLTEVEPGRY